MEGVHFRWNCIFLECLKVGFNSGTDQTFKQNPLLRYHNYRQPIGTESLKLQQKRFHGIPSRLPIYECHVIDRTELHRTEDPAQSYQYSFRFDASVHVFMRLQAPMKHLIDSFGVVCTVYLMRCSR